MVFYRVHKQNTKQIKWEKLKKNETETAKQTHQPAEKK